MKHIHKCEGCGGKLLFDPETQRLTCEYCGSKYNLTEVKNATPIKRKYSDKLKYEEVKDSNHLYECVACGTKISAHIDNNVKRCP